VCDGQRIALPSGDSLWFYEADHTYWRHNEQTGKRGKQLTGVTTVVKPLDFNSENLLRWAARTQCEGVARLYTQSTAAEYHHWLTSAEEMWKELNAHGLTYEKVRDLAGEEGTNVHMLAFEALSAGRPGLDFDALSDREKGLAAGVSAFWFDHDPNAAQVEQVVYSKQLGVAGRLDFRGRIQRRCNRNRCACHEAEGFGVIDLKTGGFISAAAHAQVGGGYPLLAEESGFGESNWAAILQVADDGTYDFFKAEGTPEAFEASVITYRHAGKINAAAKSGREARVLSRELDEQIAEAVAAS